MTNVELVMCERMHAKVMPSFCGTHEQCLGCSRVPKGVSHKRINWMNDWGSLSGSSRKFSTFLKPEEYEPHINFWREMPLNAGRNS